MDFQLPDSWQKVLAGELDKAYFKDLVAFVSAEYSHGACYPKQQQIFEAFQYCAFNDVKVVIIGQDPYHQPNQAHGLCFSVNDGIAFPPSLRNIFQEIATDIGIATPQSGNLLRWASQGVLLLNATLTVRDSSAGSHQKKGWEQFTDAVIEKITTEKQNVVFLLWGGYAKKKGAIVDSTKHCILQSGHPSPLSANKGHWFGNKHFSKTNEFLTGKGLTPIAW